MDNKAIRRANLKGLLAQAKDKGLNDADFARAVDVSDRLISQYKNGSRNMGDRFTRLLEQRMSKPKGWFDSLHFASPEDAMNAHEAMQILQNLSEADRDAWLKHGRLLVGNGPKGDGNPYGESRPGKNSN